AGTGTNGFSGDGGPATAAMVSGPSGLAVDQSGNVFFADVRNNRIREVVKATGNIVTVAGTGTNGFSGDHGPATAPQPNSPEYVTLDATANLLISDNENTRTREVPQPTGVITPTAGAGSYGFSGEGGPATGAQLAFPKGVAVDATGNVFIADQN